MSLAHQARIGALEEKVRSLESRVREREKDALVMAEAIKALQNELQGIKMRAGKNRNE